ncbi:MAG: ABC transporter ATP-binding protein [Candidatus Saccharimonas sp.]
MAQDNQHSQKRNRPMGGMGPMSAGTGEKAKDFKGTMKRMISYLRPYWVKLVVIIVLTAISTVFAIVSPKILGEATNQIVDDYVSLRSYEEITSHLPKGYQIPVGTTGADILAQMPNSAHIEEKIPKSSLEIIKNLDMTVRPTFHFAAIGRIVLWLLTLYVLSAVLRYIHSWMMVDVTQAVTYKLRRDISEKINRLPLRYFDKQTYGEVLSRVTNDVDTVSQTLNQSLSQIVFSSVMLVGIVGMMLSISWVLTLVVVLILPLGAIIIRLITKHSQKQFIAQQTQLGRMGGHIEEVYAGHQVVQVFNGKHRVIKEFTAINNKLYESGWKSQFLSGLMMPLMNFIGNLGYVGVAVTGGWLAINGHIKLGDIQAFIQYVQQFNQPIAQTANIANVLQSTAAAAERVFGFLDEAEESKEGKDLVKLSQVKGSVEFDDIVFGYKKKEPVIKHLSAKIEPGQRVAIVGPTGAGKTTLVNLLMRFYDVDSGAIKIDGVDTRKMARSDVRQMFSMVLQDAWLFHGTIRENLLYGNDRATEEDMIQAAKDAQVDHFIRSLPGGYDMMLSESVDNISQGEKQLLTIARAMLAKTPMLILDEATSSVDTRTEILIQQAMNNLMKNKTSFVIAHRLSTIRDADLILVVKAGNIVEQGTHDELLKRHGFYAELYNTQFAE